MNRDGFTDLVIGNSRATNAVYLNQTKGGHWKKIPLGTNQFNTYDITLSDLYNDGRIDIIESNSDEINRYYFNLEVESNH